MWAHKHAHMGTKKVKVRQGGCKPPCLNYAFIGSFVHIWASYMYVRQWECFFVFLADPIFGHFMGTTYTCTWGLHMAITYTIRYWLVDLYRRPDLVPYMGNDIDPDSSQVIKVPRGHRYQWETVLHPRAGCYNFLPSPITTNLVRRAHYRHMFVPIQWCAHKF